MLFHISIGKWLTLVAVFGTAAMFTIEYRRRLRRLDRQKQNLQNWAERERKLRHRHPSYVYKDLGSQALKTIRLIELLPYDGERSDEIRINLRTSSLPDPGRELYEAISYCWGDASYTWPVFCSDNSIIWATKNLHAFLKQLRLRDRPRMVWVDAICINQTDNSEKSWQVRMMDDIYRNAERVLVWLGEEADLSEHLDTFIPQLLEAKSLYDASGSTKFYYQIPVNELKAMKIPLYLRDFASYLAFGITIARPWFYRTWIIQEIALAKDAVVHCGDWSTPWDSFISAWQFVADDLKLERDIAIAYGVYHGVYGSLRENRIREIVATRDQLPGIREESFLKFLNRHANALAKDPRDKIFALVGIAPDGKDVEVNYEKSWQQVYRDVAMQILLKNRNLDILNFAGFNSSTSDTSLPSWVPDWQDEARHFALEHQRSLGPEGTFYVLFNATDGAEWIPILPSDEMVLQLDGYELDSIATVGSAAPSLSSDDSVVKPIDYLIVLAEWAGICHAFTDGLYKHTGQHLSHAFWQIIERAAGNGSNDFYLTEPMLEIMAPKVKFFHMFRNLPFCWSLPVKLFCVALLPLYLRSNPFKALMHRVRNDPEVAPYISVMIAGLKIIKTQRGYIGMAAGDASVGDKIFLLRGGRTPYILRSNEKGKHALFIGQCYLHGIMHGQEWDSKKCHLVLLA